MSKVSKHEAQPLSRDDALAAARAAYQHGKWKEARALLERILSQHPEDTTARELLEEAELRAGIEGQTRVRPRLVIFPWRRLATMVGMVTLLLLAGWGGVKIYGEKIGPGAEIQRIARQRQALFAEAQEQFLEGQFDATADTLTRLLEEQSDYPGAQELLDRAEEEADLLERYDRAVKLHESGSTDAAMEELVQINITRVGYRDVSARISDINRLKQREDLYLEAIRLEEDGDLAGALGLYQEVQRLDAGFRPDFIRGKLFDLHLSLGVEIAERVPPVLEALPEAVEHFEQALMLRPREATAAGWRDLITDFMSGQSRYHQGAWGEAVRLLRSVYDRRPSFVQSTLLGMLYTAYINLGDLYQGQGDVGAAYAQYLEASNLPVDDTALADKRIVDIVPVLTPTATPTATATPTERPTPAPPRAPTPVPTPRPLNAFHNMIIFISDHEDSPGYWAMAPDGSQRQYLGRTSAIRKEYEALKERQLLSPDSRYRLFIRNINGIAQIFVQDPPTSQFPNPPPRQLTEASGLCYDPAWAPDGSRIVFVSEASGSDDIHIINADGSGGRNLTENSWPWEKHPSWSPDSSRIVFWSNRELRKQIYIMDAQGRGVTNISNSEYDEYDPVWVR